MNAKELVVTIDRSFRMKGNRGAECILIPIMEWERIKHRIMEG